MKALVIPKYLPTTARFHSSKFARAKQPNRKGWAKVRSNKSQVSAREYGAAAKHAKSGLGKVTESNIGLTPSSGRRPEKNHEPTPAKSLN